MQQLEKLQQRIKEQVGSSVTCFLTCNLLIASIIGHWIDQGAAYSLRIIRLRTNGKALWVLNREARNGLAHQAEGIASLQDRLTHLP